MEKVYGCCGLITNLRNVTDKLSDYKTNDIGVVQYPGTNDEGYAVLSDASLSGIGQFIIDAINTYTTQVKWYCVRATPSPGVSGYFKNGSFSILWCMSSVNYGWSVLMSDSDKIIVFGRLSAGVWYWYAPTLTAIS